MLSKNCCIILEILWQKKIQQNFGIGRLEIFVLTFDGILFTPRDVIQNQLYLGSIILVSRKKYLRYFHYSGDFSVFYRHHIKFHWKCKINCIMMCQSRKYYISKWKKSWLVKYCESTGLLKGWYSLLYNINIDHCQLQAKLILVQEGTFYMSLGSSNSKQCCGISEKPKFLL